MAKSELSYFEERFKESESKIGISLSLCRKNISTMLSLIPRTGFFRTYTDHSINHCSSMFGILTWLIPEEIKKRLSDTECSLLVLSVYIHDLGMLATQQEFETRSQNPEFIKFEHEYVFDFNTNAPISADHPTKDHFIFEEFIRHTHADRIHNWIQNDFSSLPQESELKPLFHSASESLRYYLALICKSHHLNNLHDTTLYPTEFYFGSDSANIQFLAICLRLADILHLTSDRTPPIEFRILSPKNPVSAREWAKQIHVSGIGISRTNSSIINIDAVCKDHRAFFYIRDFISVINKELQQCLNWLDIPARSISQKYFLIVKSVTDEGLKAIGFIAEKFSLQIDHKRTIELLMGNNLYGDNKVVIRELIQNSIDAVKVRLLETEKLKPKIRIELDNLNRTLKITDNGIGMDLDILRQHFLRVGDSYYRSNNFKKRCPNYTPISQFGIGFLTSFMIADKVEVITKSCKESSKILKLVLEDIYDLFAVTELDTIDNQSKLISTGGTIIKLFLREGIKFDNLNVEVAKWIVYLNFAIEVVIDNNPATLITGIQGSTAEEIGKDIIERFSDDYTEYCPILIENKDVIITVLWEGNKFGDEYLLAPAGRLLLPLSRSMYYFGRGDMERDMRRMKEKSDIRKVANGGIFLSEILPGFKLSEGHHRPNFHYVIDCRGETRFTPLVSRAGIAVDSASIEILSFFYCWIDRIYIKKRN
jgi:molecular chaperone HtpG